MSLNLTKIKENINENKKTNTINLDCNDFQLSVKNNPIFAEKTAFVERVVESSFIDNIPSKIAANLAFSGYFMLYFSNLPELINLKSMEETISLNELAEVADGLNIINRVLEMGGETVREWIYELKEDINTRINFEMGKIILESSAIGKMAVKLQDIIDVLEKQTNDPELNKNALETITNLLTSNIKESLSRHKIWQ